MGNALIAILTGVAAGILLATAGAKLRAAIHMRLAWPEGANFFRLHLPSGLVIAMEILIAAAALALPSVRLSCLLLAVVYAAFVVGASTLRGKECGCFGIEGMTVGRVHIWGCALAAAALAMAAVFGQSLDGAIPARAAAAAASVMIVVLAIALWDRHGEPVADAAHDRLLVVLSPTCTACSALQVMEEHELNDVEAGGTICWIDRDSEAAALLRDSGVSISTYPSVVSVSTADPANARVDSGLQECREVLRSWRERHPVAQ